MTLPAEISIDPWSLINFKKLGYLIFILATIEYSSFRLAKIFGHKRSSLIIGFLGGLVSSTAILVSSARKARQHPTTWRDSLSTAIAATISALVELLLIVVSVSPTLFLQLWAPVSAGILFSTGALVIFYRKDTGLHSQVSLPSPADWRGILRLSFTLAAVFAIISATKIWLGNRAIYAASALMGLFELHVVSLANATMESDGALDLATATLSILVAITASFIAKIGAAWALERGEFSRNLTFVFIPMAIVVMATAWLVASN